MGFKSSNVEYSRLPIEAYLVRFQVLTAASMKVTVSWDVAPCSLAEIDRRFRGASAAIIIAKSFAQ
jgi:hypothetical protein